MIHNVLKRYYEGNEKFFQLYFDGADDFRLRFEINEGIKA